MNYRIASGKPLSRLIATLTAAGLLSAAVSIVAAPAAFAQKPKPQPKPNSHAAAPQQPAPAPNQPAQTTPQLMYSSWVKLCQKGQDTDNKQVCVMTKDGRLENGVPVAIVQLFEPEGAQKVLRVTVPLGMQLQHGTRIIVDKEQPVQAAYKICFPVGCMSDYAASDDLVKKLRNGHTLTVQAINMQGTPISLPMPLNDFAKVLDGPATDPKVFQAQQQKLQEELRKKAEEARQRLQQGQGAPAANGKNP